MGASQNHAILEGRVPFVTDLVGSADFYAHFIRSEVPHGTIKQLDFDACQSSPGVAAVLTGEDLPLPPIANAEIKIANSHLFARPLLAKNVVRFVGEPIAVILASTERQGRDAAEKAWVDIDFLPAVTDPIEALHDSTLLFPAAGTNTVVREGFPSGSKDHPGLVEVTVEIRHPRVAPSPIEPPAIIARPSGGGQLSIVCGHQEPHRLRDEIAALLGLDHSELDVRVPAVGGSFGLKGVLIPEYAVVAAAARKLGRSVAWVSTRRELFISGTHGRSQVNRVTLWGEHTGRFVGARLVVLADTGAYPQPGVGLPFNTRFIFPGPYQFEELESEVRVVATNKAPVGPYRGAGRLEAVATLERAIDAFARKNDLDPAHVRQMNLIPPERIPFISLTGAKYDSGDYQAALSRLLDEIGYMKVRRTQDERRREKATPIGIGLCCFVDRSGGGITSGEYGEVEITVVGEVVVRSGATSTGQPHTRLWARLVGAELGVDPDQVRVISGDTTEVETGVGSFGSRSAQLGGAAATSAARTVKQILLDSAADALGTDPRDLTTKNGWIWERASDANRISFADAVAASLRRGVAVKTGNMYVPGAMTYPYGACGAVVEVELETGVIRILDLVMVSDCGTVLDYRGVHDQCVGALAQGYGEAMSEEFSYSVAGQPLTSSLMDYLLPSATDTPTFRVFQTTHEAPSNLLGAKGIAELGTIGAPPAIANAVNDALSSLGIKSLDVPLRPNQIWNAIRDVSWDRGISERPQDAGRDTLTAKR